MYLFDRVNPVWRPTSNSFIVLRDLLCYSCIVETSVVPVKTATFEHPVFSIILTFHPQVTDVFFFLFQLDFVLKRGLGRMKSLDATHAFLAKYNLYNQSPSLPLPACIDHQTNDNKGPL